MPLLRVRPGKGIMAMGALWTCLLFLPGLAGGAGVGSNLIPNPGFDLVQADTGLPQGWSRKVVKVPSVTSSQAYLCRVEGHPGKFLALVGGADRGGRVSCEINDIRPHTQYILEFDAYRPPNSPTASIWRWKYSGSGIH